MWMTMLWEHVSQSRLKLGSSHRIFHWQHISSGWIFSGVQDYYVLYFWLILALRNAWFRIWKNVRFRNAWFRKQQLFPTVTVVALVQRGRVESEVAHLPPLIQFVTLLLGVHTKGNATRLDIAKERGRKLYENLMVTFTQLVHCLLIPPNISSLITIIWSLLKCFSLLFESTVCCV